MDRKTKHKSRSNAVTHSIKTLKMVSVQEKKSLNNPTKDALEIEEMNMSFEGEKEPGDFNPQHWSLGFTMSS